MSVRLWVKFISYKIQEDSDFEHDKDMKTILEVAGCPLEKQEIEHGLREPSEAWLVAAAERAEREADAEWLAGNQKFLEEEQVALSHSREAGDEAAARAHEKKKKEAEREDVGGAEGDGWLKKVDGGEVKAKLC
ncbi:MAG: hypothetical protein MMC33_000415 [Icmadophila ericetorum]|nr:hypothetical protein [Icmadophila ericetorum]